jgi:hypothetical protein
VIRFLADENFNINIVLGVRSRNPGVDILRVQEAGITGYPDPDILRWAAESGRVILTHDADDMPRFAYERISEGMEMAGVFEVRQNHPMAIIIEDILLLADASHDNEWANQIRYLPLR